MKKLLLLCACLAISGIACISHTDKPVAIKNTKAIQDSAGHVTSAANNDDADTIEDNLPIRLDSMRDMYLNPRFKYDVVYPHKLLIPEKEAVNGDGRLFTDVKGDECLTVSGTNSLYSADLPDPTEATLRQEYTSVLRELRKKPKTKIDYCALGRSYYIISGIGNDALFFNKTIVTKEGYAHADLCCPVSKRSFFNEVVKVCKSLKASY